MKKEPTICFKFDQTMQFKWNSESLSCGTDDVI